MARIAANATSTNQGRADLRRVPTGAQTDFNQNGASSISVVRSGLLKAATGGGFETPTFSPLVPTLTSPTSRRLCVFLWMTDRITSVSAEQFYNGTVFPEAEEALPVGKDLCSCATVAPTNGMAGLPTGLACSTLSATEVGAQATLSTTALPAASALSVRGTPLLVALSDNSYYGEPGETQTALTAEVRIEALSESLLSGKPDALFLPLVNGSFDAYVESDVAVAQIILEASAYLAGQYWLSNNQLVLGGVTFNIVGIYTAPVPPVPPTP